MNNSHRTAGAHNFMATIASMPSPSRVKIRRCAQPSARSGNPNKACRHAFDESLSSSSYFSSSFPSEMKTLTKNKTRKYIYSAPNVRFQREGVQEPRRQQYGRVLLCHLVDVTRSVMPRPRLSCSWLRRSWQAIGQEVPQQSRDCSRLHHGMHRRRICVRRLKLTAGAKSR